MSPFLENLFDWIPRLGQDQPSLKCEAQSLSLTLNCELLPLRGCFPSLRDI